MPILIALGAAAIVGGVSYLVPLIITCIAGAVTIVVTFVSTRAYYKKDHAKDTEMQNLKKEQAERDAAVRDEVSRIAEETGVNVQTLLELSKEQQSELKKTIQEFMQNIEDSDRATQSLNELAQSIQAATNDANIQQSDLYIELEQMKTELRSVQNKLSNTERALANKESELQQTIATLSELVDKINCSGVIEQVDKLAKSEINQDYKDAEIMRLKAQNTTLNHTIDSLDISIKDLQSKLKSRTKMEKLQIQEIQELITENKRLTATIESLTESMESNNAKAAQLTSNTSHQLRLFK